MELFSPFFPNIHQVLGLHCRTPDSPTSFQGPHCTEMTFSCGAIDIVGYSWYMLNRQWLFWMLYVYHVTSRDTCTYIYICICICIHSMYQHKTYDVYVCINTVYVYISIYHTVYDPVVHRYAPGETCCRSKLKELFFEHITWIKCEVISILQLGQRFWN